MERIVIVGGAGFIGSHLADELLARNYRVCVLDSLIPEVHGPARMRPSYLAADVELHVADVRDRVRVRRALEGADAVVHLAARVGVGQSMYRVEDYTSANGAGTAVLLEELIQRPVRRLVVASSMSIYGEGLAATREGEPVASASRTVEQLRRGEWELVGEDGRALVPLPTPETKSPALESVYALSKYDQERLCLMIGRAYGIEVVALRLFNVYGTRQALSNPYTGVLAIFASRLLNGARPLVFEDGEQRRDFVSVHDVARAFRLALERPGVGGCVLNVGSGSARTVREVAVQMAAAMVRPIEPELTGKYRMGDVRHCFADIREANRRLGYEPKVSFAEGLGELCGWLEGQVADDRALDARAELDRRGLTL